MWRIWRAVSVVGGLIALAGVVALIWLQADAPVPSSYEGSYRWQIAMTPLMVVALGLIVVGVGWFLEMFTEDDDDVLEDALDA